MTSPLALPIARLRATGCRVVTVIGHDPSIGDFKYSVRVPDAIGDLRESGPQAVTLGRASASVPRHSDGHHLIVKAYGYRRGLKTPKTLINECRTDVATLLDGVADVIEEML